jgi:hypothetical protein
MKSSKSKMTRKLSLAGETIRHLSKNDLGRVGGAEPVATSSVPCILNENKTKWPALCPGPATVTNCPTCGTCPPA